MNRSKQFLPVIAAGLALLALPALAQNSGSPGSSSNPPSTTRSDRDQRPGPPEYPRPGDESSSMDSGADSSRTRGSDMDSRTPIHARGNVLFDHLDSDRDGRLSEAEYTRSSFTNPGSVSGSASAGATARSGGASGAIQSGQNSAETFRQLDTNRDGYLSSDELYAGQPDRMRGNQEQRKP